MSEQVKPKRYWVSNPNGRPKKEVKKSEQMMMRFFAKDLKRLANVAELEHTKKAKIIDKAIEEYYEKRGYEFDEEGNIIENGLNDVDFEEMEF